jgi:two-component system sensor histidine kinase VicK
VSGGIALFRDISAEKEVERQRDEFISTASHEMRTPVAAVEGYLSLAMNPAVATIDDRAKQYLEKAHSATQHLGQLFRDLLSVTKLEDNRLSPDEVFDLTALVKDVVSDMKFEANKKGLEIQFGAEDQRIRGENTLMPVYATRANPQRLREVMTNLIENAIKFTPQGSIRVAIGGSNDTISVSVTDSGIGIAPEDIDHLFQKFYRIDNTATRTIGGTGLGLYLCRSIIERAGGRIWVESQPGSGSTFHFSLPRQASDKIGKTVTAAPPTPAVAPVSEAPAPTPTPAPEPTPVPAAPSAPVMAASVPTQAPAQVATAPAQLAPPAPTGAATPVPVSVPSLNPNGTAAGRAMTDIKKPAMAGVA